MLDKYIIEKLLDRSPLAVIVIGVFMFILGAAGGMPLGNPPLTVPDIGWRISLAIMGIVLSSAGLLLLKYESKSSSSLKYRDSQYATIQSNPKDAFQALIQAYQTSQNKIEIISWWNIDEQLNTDSGKIYIEATLKAINQLPSKSFRWLVWNSTHLDYVEEIVKMYPQFRKAQIHFYFPSQNQEMPLIPCSIVDEKISNFGWGYLGYPDKEQVNISATDSKIVESFRLYFAHLWESSVSLQNDDGSINREMLEMQKKRFIPSIVVQATPQKAYQELGEAYEKSRRSIDIISWKNLQQERDNLYKKPYFEKLQEALRKSPSIVCRRILWTPEHLEILERWVADYADIPNAQFGYFNPIKYKDTTILPCVIVDKEIANFGWGYLGLPKVDEINITVRHPESVTAFVEYFALLWEKTTLLSNPQGGIDRKKILEIKKHLAGQHRVLRT